jgi:hypothetical protein
MHCTEPVTPRRDWRRAFSRRVGKWSLLAQNMGRWFRPKNGRLRRGVVPSTHFRCRSVVGAGGEPTAVDEDRGCAGGAQEKAPSSAMRDDDQQVERGFHQSRLSCLVFCPVAWVSRSVSRHAGRHVDNAPRLAHPTRPAEKKESPGGMVPVLCRSLQHS